MLAKIQLFVFLQCCINLTPKRTLDTSSSVALFPPWIKGNFYIKVRIILGLWITCVIRFSFVFLYIWWQRRSSHILACLMLLVFFFFFLIIGASYKYSMPRSFNIVSAFSSSSIFLLYAHFISGWTILCFTSFKLVSMTVFIPPSKLHSFPTNPSHFTYCYFCEEAFLVVILDITVHSSEFVHQIMSSLSFVWL